MKKVIIIDGYNFLFRAFYAIRDLTREDGLHTNALYGLTTMVLKSIETLQPDICLVALDSGKKTFRNDIFSEYKANRKEPPEELKQQFEYVEPLLQALGLTVLKEEGFEADDIIATVAKKLDKEQYELVIVSSDKDLMQLVTDEVCMFDAGKQKFLCTDEVVEKFGVTPDKVIEVQSLIGDSVDNIPGVKSVGPKTASALINEYSTLEGIYENIDKITKAKLKENLIACKEDAFMSRKLAKLDADMNIEVGKYLQTYVVKKDKLLGYLEFLGFNSLVKKLSTNGELKGKFNGSSPKKNEKNTEKEAKNIVQNYMTVNSIEMFDVWIERLYDSEIFAIDTETNSLNKREAELVGISLATQEGEACYIPLAHNLDMLSTDSQLDLDFVLEKLKPILSDKEIIKIGQNIKYDMHVLSRYGVEFNNIDDTMVMSFVLNGSKHKHNMDDLSDIYLDHKTIKFSELGLAKGQTFADIHIEQATKYAAEDADITLRLYNVFKEMLANDENLSKVYNKIERPLIKTLFNMEDKGVKIDYNKLAELSSEFEFRIKDLEKEIYKIAGKEFNIASPKQLGEVLFDDLGIEGGKKTKTGWKTSQEVLDMLVEQGHEIAKKIEEFRHLSKLKSTYIDALPKHTDPITNRVHTTYNQIGAGTGRLASSDPNLQNIPIRTLDGQKIRECFIPENGYSFVSIDYSQVELRLLAALANIEPLVKAFNADKDIHAFTAKKIFGSDDKDFRRQAKTINFGIIYGMGPFSLAKQLGISNKDAKDLIAEYYNMFKGLEEFMSETKQKALDLGYVETYYGRKIFLPGAESTNKMVQSNALRAAVNAPMQGTSADIIKLAMPKIEEYLEKHCSKCKMLMQIHDELVFAIPDSQVEDVSKNIQTIMEGISDLKVKLKADIGVGKDWNSAH